MNLTVRNIPDEVINKIRTLSKIERRSLNNEILIVLEQGLNEKFDRFFDIKRNMTKEIQTNIWTELAKKWEDDRTSEEIIKDIYSKRTAGREFEL